MLKKKLIAVFFTCLLACGFACANSPLGDQEPSMSAAGASPLEPSQSRYDLLTAHVENWAEETQKKLAELRADNAQLVQENLQLTQRASLLESRYNQLQEDLINEDQKLFQEKASCLNTSTVLQKALLQAEFTIAGAREKFEACSTVKDNNFLELKNCKMLLAGTQEDFRRYAKEYKNLLIAYNRMVLHEKEIKNNASKHYSDKVLVKTFIRYFGSALGIGAAWGERRFLTSVENSASPSFAVGAVAGLIAGDFWGWLVIDVAADSLETQREENL